MRGGRGAARRSRRGWSGSDANRRSELPWSNDPEARPLGSQKVERADARVIAATNKSLETESMNGRFREDLLYRLNVVTIHVPPLRERAEDIPQLVKSFAEHFRAKHRRGNKHFSAQRHNIFLHLPLPGNAPP